MACMPDIFISYSSLQRDVVRSLAATIEGHFGAGAVWWDQAGLRAGDRFSPEITRALDDAKAVVVVWTAGALESDWVYAEAARAVAGRKVVMARAAEIDPARIPLPFNGFHSCLVEDTTAVLTAIEKRLSGEGSRVPPSLPGQGFLLDPKQEGLPQWAGATRPASLLLARHRVVPFDDIHGLRARFVTWATEVPQHAFGRPVLGCLLHGAGGLGKTRALIEIAEELTSTHGWLAGFVPRDIRGSGRELSEGALERLLLSGRDAKGLMVIVDYAESRQDDVVWFADRLVRRAQTVSTPARLVLLSRGSGVWWRELLLRSQSLQDLCSVGGEAYDEISVPEAIARPHRRALFEASLAAFRARRDSVGRQQPVPATPSADLVRAIETEGDYDCPLAVQIAALLQTFGVDIEGHSMGRLLDRVLGLEYDHWDKVLKIRGEPSLQKAIKIGVAQTTLVGGIDSAEAARALIGRNDLLRDARDVDEAMARLSSILPVANDGVAALEPDLIGEHHVLEVVTDALVDSCVDWTEPNNDRRRHVLTVLNRATRAEHGAAASRAHAQLRRLVETQASRLAGDFITVAVETPGQLLDLCSTLELQVPGLDPLVIDAIAAALPGRSLTLMPLSLRVAERLAESARIMVAAAEAAADTQPHHHDETLSHLAARVRNLGIRLSDLGRHEEALAATQEALDIYRRFAQARPDAFLPDLAASLTNLSNQVSYLGRREKALAAAQEALDIYRRLAQTRPEPFLLYLAGSLNNIGERLSHLGRREEALAATQEALDIYRRARPDTFLPNLATSLDNLGIRLSNLGRHEEALAATQEAVDIRRRLVQTRPDAFLPNLTASLNNRGIWLSNLGCHEKALAPTLEAVEIARRLVQARPDAFLPDLATSLNNLGETLSDLGRREEALVATQEALDIYRRFAQARPDAFLPDLAASLDNLGIRLSDLGRHEEALAVSQEALDIIRRLAQTRPDAFLPDVARNLTNLGARLSHLGRREEALAATQEAVDIRRRLVQTRPDAFLPELARSLGAHSDALGALKQYHEAAQVTADALRILLPYVERYPETYGGLARDIVACLQRYSDAAGTAANEALLEQAAIALAPALADPINATSTRLSG